jgi:hypothetical protein
MGFLKLKHYYPEYQQLEVAGHLVSVGQNEVYCSMESIAEDLYTLLVGKRNHYTKHGDRKRGFEAFYRRVCRAIKRLTTYIEPISYAAGSAQGLHGTVWKITDTRAQEASASLSASQSLTESAEAQLIEALIHDDPEKYCYAESCVTIYRKTQQYSHHGRWERQVLDANPASERHTSIGSWATTNPINTTPCMIPWLVIEPESTGGDLWDNYNATQNVLQGMAIDGIELNQIRVTFSGNKSFHIRIPCGAFGNPVFKSGDWAREVILRWTNDNIDSYVDLNLLNPFHLVRMTGSVNQKTGRRCVSWQGDEFGSITVDDVMRASLDGKNEYYYSPQATVPDPVLVDSLREACNPYKIPHPKDVEYNPDIVYSNAYARSLEGCEEGEQWHTKHAGRNKLVYVAACYLLQKYEHKIDAWNELQIVNERNSPPISMKSVKSCFKSAQRSLASQRYQNR